MSAKPRSIIAQLAGSGTDTANGGASGVASVVGGV
jgi:hypothetical protein